MPTPRMLIPIGSVFGRLTILSEATRTRRARCLCQCSCGALKIVQFYNLRSGHVSSCGCLRRDIAKQKTYKHGEARKGHVTREFRLWLSMISRCHYSRNQAYPGYGGRGIVVCERWRTSFGNFLSDMGRRPSPQHSLDRFPDNNGNYEPGNVRWATRIEQAGNTRSTRHLTFRGETLCMSEWGRRLGLGFRLISSRLQKGWTVERALSTPRQIQQPAFPEESDPQPAPSSFHETDEERAW